MPYSTDPGHGNDDGRAVPLFALGSEMEGEVGRLLPRLGLETRVDAHDMMNTVASTFWQRFDDMPEEDYLVPEVYVTEASEEMASGWLVAVNRNTNRYWRVSWSYDDSGRGTAEVEYDNPDTWTEVEEKWVSVEGEAERLLGQALTRKMGAGTSRAASEDLSEGTQVRWDASGGTAYGEIEEIATSGTISAEPEGPTMEGSEDEPAYGVRVYDINSDGEWEETDTLTVHRASALTVIDGFPEDRARRTRVRKRGRDHRAIMEGAELRMSSDGERTTVQFMTESLARDGLVLDADGLDLSAYRENPVVLWQHGQDPRRGGQPIAKTVDIARNADGYLATIEWYDDGFSQEIKRQVKEGYLNAASIGWRTEDLDFDQDPPRVAASDMTEFSIVSVPADAGALVAERSSTDRQNGDSMQHAIREIRALRHEVAVHVRGESLAGTLSDAINEMTGEETSSQDVQEEMADAAGISPSTIDEILSAEIECPPLERLEGFAEVLDINLDTIIAAAENDGCEYDRSRCGCAGTGATAPSPPNATGSPATGDDPAAEDRDAAQDRTRLVRLSDVKRLKEKRKQEKRRIIRTELKQQLGMA